MAGPPFDVATAAAALTSNNSPSFVFDVYDDARSGATGPSAVRSSAPAPPLPTGACNFVDLTHGANGPQCGCRRFWSRTNIATAPASANSFGNNSPSSADSQAGWCMCSHHACFHDQGPPSPVTALPDTASSAVNAAAAAAAHSAPTNVTNASLFGLPSQAPPVASSLGQENERPRANRAPLSPVQDPMAFQLFTNPDTNDVEMSSFGLLPLNSSTRIGSSFGNIFVDPAPFEGQTERAAAAVGEHATPTPTSIAPSVATSVGGHGGYDGSIPDTMSCGGGLGGHATLNSALLSSPAPPSVTSSVSQTRYLRPFAGKGLHTLTHTATACTSAPSPLKALVAADTEAAAAGAAAEGSQAATQPGLGSLAGAVQAHEQRLEKLENASFSVPYGQEEWSERHDHMDMRVTELESRVDEVEKRLSCDDTASGMGGSVVLSRRRLLGSTDDDATTVSGLDTSMSTGTSHGDLLRSQIVALQALQATVERLQAGALPTYAQPWELEVVFLPFPPKGIWVEAGQFPAATTAQRRQSGGNQRHSGHNAGQREDDDWTQMPNTLSRQTPDPQSPMGGGSADWASNWADGSAAAGSAADAPRLLPRACAPGRVVDNRLRSCGLVQTVTVRGCDARSLQLAMAAAFGPIFDAMALGAGRVDGRVDGFVHPSAAADALQAQFLGLQQPWVPLRKLHKDSCLRFLSRAEMVTPSIWDAAFLQSVVMKASGRQRLYVTHPDAYLQDSYAYHTGWSWQRLRELHATIGPVASAAGVDESCWAWSSRLDNFPSALPSASLAAEHHLPSPSPFSRESTPTNGPHSRHRSFSSPQPTAVPGQPTAVSVNRSHRSSTGASISAQSVQQYFTAAQSPVLQPPTGPWASLRDSGARRSPSPFSPSSLPTAGTSASLRKSRRSTPIRTTSMPAPPSQTGRHASLMATLSSPSPIGKGRLSAASNHYSASSHQRPRQQQPAAVVAAVTARAYERRSSPLASLNRPSSRSAQLPSPVSNASVPAPIVMARTAKRRRSTRSPSGLGPRYTPRRSMSRSPSVQPMLPQSTQPPVPAFATPQAPNAPNAPIRGTTPFCYATPHSNAPTMEPSMPPSSRQRSARPSGGEVDFDLDMMGDDGMGGYDDDLQMTQDTDNNEPDDEVKIFDDEAERSEGGVETGRTGCGQPQSVEVKPEDKPLPGIVDVVQNADGDAHMSDSENMGGASGESGFSMPQTQSCSPSQHSDQNSSQPSEYPSTHPAWPVGAATLAALKAEGRLVQGEGNSGNDFIIHEDAEDAVDGMVE